MARKRRRPGRNAQRGSLARIALADGTFAVRRGDPEWRVKYETYMTSSAWRLVRQRFIAASGTLVCRACGNHSNVALHHRTYDRLGEELLDDLVPLCDSCHRGVHELHRSGRYALDEATDLVIKPPVGPARMQESDRPKFVPANQRGARRLPDGRLISALDWHIEDRSLRGLTNDYGQDD